MLTLTGLVLTKALPKFHLPLFWLEGVLHARVNAYRTNLTFLCQHLLPLDPHLPYSVLHLLIHLWNWLGREEPMNGKIEEQSR